MNKELREFSKEHFSKDRSDLAKDLVSRRKELYNKKEEFVEEKNSLEESIDTKEKHLSDIIERLSEKEVELENIDKNLINKLLTFFRLSKLRQEINDIKVDKDKLIEENTTLHKNLSQLQNLPNQLKEVRANLRNNICVFSEKISEEYERWLDYGNIANICKRYNEIILHGIMPRGEHDNNRNFKGSSFSELYAVIDKYRPTISTSTFKKTDKRENMWHHVGVIIKNGMVTAASDRDMGTIAETIKKRKSPNASRENLEEKIKQAHNRLGYNELTVKEPEIAAIYIYQGEDDRKRPYDVTSEKEVVDFANKYNIPIVFIKNNNFFDENNQELSIEEILNMEPKCNPGTVFEDVIKENCPFRLECFKNIDAYCNGEMNYILFNKNRLSNNDNGIISNITFIDEPLTVKKVNEDVRIINNKNTNVGNYNLLEDEDGWFVTISNSGNVKIKELSTNLEYLNSLEKEYLNNLEISDKNKIQILYNIYGYVCKAKDLGDIETYNHGIGIIKKYEDIDDIDKIIGILDKKTGKIIASSEFIDKQLELSK